jgi:hypothetical protein
VLLSIPLQLGFIHLVRYRGEEGENARLRHDERVLKGVGYRREASRVTELK